MYLILDILAVSSHWIVKTGLKRHKHNYPDLIADLFGQTAGYMHCMVTLIFPSLGCVAYMMILGDSLEHVSVGLGATGVFADRRFYIAVCAVFIMLPLCCFRNMVS